MINIEYTYSSNNGSAAKLFKVTDEDLTIEQKVPNQARLIIKYALELGESQGTFTFADLEQHIDANEIEFTRSKGGTMRILRYYSKLLQEIGLLIPA